MPSGPEEGAHSPEADAPPEQPAAPEPEPAEPEQADDEPAQPLSLEAAQHSAQQYDELKARLTAAQDPVEQQSLQAQQA